MLEAGRDRDDRGCDEDQGRAGALPELRGCRREAAGRRAVAEARKAAIGAFAALGLPHRRIEEWKYTDLRSALKEALAPAVGGDGQGDRRARSTRRWRRWPRSTPIAWCSSTALHRARAFAPGRGRGAGGRRRWRRRCQVGRPPATACAARAPTGQEAVIALNTAFMTDGAVIRVAKGAQLDKPLLLVFARAGQRGRLVTTRNVIEIGDGAHATVIEAHVALAGRRTRPGQHAERCGARRRRASRSRQGHARRRRPPSHLATWLATLGRGRDLSRLPADGGDGAGAQQSLRHLQGRGRQARHLRLRSSGAAPSTSTPRWWSITRCPAARAASCSRAC